MTYTHTFTPEDPFRIEWPADAHPDDLYPWRDEVSDWMYDNDPELSTVMMHGSLPDTFTVTHPIVDSVRDALTNDKPMVLDRFAGRMDPPFNVGRSTK